MDGESTRERLSGVGNREGLIDLIKNEEDGIIDGKKKQKVTRRNRGQ